MNLALRCSKFEASECFVFKVLFPSGAKVVIRRNTWGLDVIIDTPRASDINNEKGLCLGSDPIYQRR